MDQIARQWIMNAFKNAAGKPCVGAMYIDLQSTYIEQAEHNKIITRLNKTFSEQARKYNIRNLWIAMTRSAKAWKRFKLHEFASLNPQHHFGLFPIATPNNDEWIYTKDESSAHARPSPLHDNTIIPLRTDTKDLDLLFAGGLDADRCVARSIIGALRYTNANLIALIDLTNVETGTSKEEYKEQILSLADEEEREEFSKRLVVSNTETAISALTEANPQPASRHHTRNQPQPLQ